MLFYKSIYCGKYTTKKVYIVFTKVSPFCFFTLRNKISQYFIYCGNKSENHNTKLN